MDELTRAVFHAAYRSRAQCNLRLLLGALLVLKHIGRGLIFSWPLYVLAFASWAIPGLHTWAFLLLLIPAAAVSGLILRRGLREDYKTYVAARLLKRGDIRRALFGGAR